MFQLREYQRTLDHDVRAAFRLAETVTLASGEQKKNPINSVLAVLPTGGGKTVIFVHMVGGAASWGNRSIILVHRQELLKQTSKALQEQGIEHGFIAAGYPRNNAMVQIAMVGTLASQLRRGKLITPPQLLVIDECHHVNASTWAVIVDWARAHNAKILGVTATPERGDGKGLGEYFQKMVLGPSPSWLIENGYLSKPRYILPPQVADLSNLHTRYGEYVNADLVEAMDRPSVTGDAIKHYLQHGHGMPAVAFCVSVAHAEHVAEEFCNAGIPAASIDGTLDEATRAQRVKDLSDGTIRVLTSCNLISEGFDLPRIGCAILLRPTKSVALHLQQMGRALRPFPGKEFAVIIDHVGNIAGGANLGTVEEDRLWTLEGREKGKGKPREVSLLITCDHCYAGFKKEDVVNGNCPVCGTPLPKRETNIEQVEGELREFSAEEIANARAVAAQIKKQKDEEKGLTYYALARRAEKDGRPLEWADRQFLAALTRYGFPRDKAQKQLARDRAQYERQRERKRA